MKKRLLALLCTLALCFSAFAVAGCGNSNSGGTESNGEKEKEETPVEVPADPAEKFVGEWKMALMEAQGLKIVGDVSAMLETEGGINMSVKDDKTGSLTLGDEGGDFTWELKDDDNITLTITENGDSQTVNVAYVDDALVLEYDEGDTPYKITFTKDGTIKDYEAVTPDSMEDITSSEQLLGSWNMCGVSMQGMSAYGDAETIAQFSGLDDISMTFTDDGKVTLAGSSIDWVVDDNGARVENAGQSIPLKISGDYLVMDMSEYVGSEIYALFSK